MNFFCMPGYGMVSRSGRCWRLAPISLLVLSCAIGGSEAAIEQPEGYRLHEFYLIGRVLGHYDARVPDRLDGARSVTAAEVKRLQSERDAVVIDVIPAQRRPAGLPENQIWMPLAHRGVPGGIWLPDVGYGVLSATTEDYFRSNLEAATHGNRDHPVVFYCRANCWMSWNAAKRALGYGFTNVYWFYDGVDGWLLEDYDFEILQPQPGLRQPEIIGD